MRNDVIKIATTVVNEDKMMPVVAHPQPNCFFFEAVTQPMTETIKETKAKSPTIGIQHKKTEITLRRMPQMHQLFVPCDKGERKQESASETELTDELVGGYGSFIYAKKLSIKSYYSIYTFQ